LRFIRYVTLADQNLKTIRRRNHRRFSVKWRDGEIIKKKNKNIFNK